MALTYEELIGIQEKRKKQTQQEQKAAVASSKPYAQRLISPADDIAPVKKFTPTTTTKAKPTVTASTNKKEDDSGLFKKSSYFDDGWDFGDVAKTILGSVTDIGEWFTKGALGSGEKWLDGLMALGTAMNRANMNQANFNMMSSPLAVSKKGNEYARGLIAQSDAIRKESEKKTAEFIAKGLYDEGDIAKKIIRDTVMDATGVDVQGGSVFGEQSRSLAESAGNMIANKIVGTIMGDPTGMIAIGLSAGGGEMNEALKQGAAYDEAMASGIVTASAEMAGGALFNGVKFGGHTLTEGAVNKVASALSNKVFQTLAKWGINTAGEGAEEVVSDFISSVGKKVTYLNEKEFNEIFNKQSAWESFLGGMLLGGFFEGTDIVASKINGVDYVTGESKNALPDVVKQVYDKVVEDKILEATKENDGKTISKREEAKIRNDILRSINEGSMDIDTIESIIDPEGFEKYKSFVDKASEYEARLNEGIEKIQARRTELQEEYSTLNKMKQGEMTGDQLDRRADIKDEIASLDAAIEQWNNELEEYKNDTEAKKLMENLKKKLGQSVFEKVKDTRLAESYYEVARGKQAFEADTSKYKNEKARQTVQNAMDSGLLGNSNAEHKAVDFVAKVTSKIGLVCKFESAEQIKNGFIEEKTKKIAELESIPEAQRTAKQNKLLADMKEAVEEVKSGKLKVNGNITKGVITIDPKSKKAIEFITGHEILHHLVKSKVYRNGDLEKAFKSYLGEEEFAKRLKQAEWTYRGDETDPGEENLADLTGEFVFNDYDFVMHLATTNHNIFRNFWDSINHLYKMATAGSKEARELERVKRNFEKAYKEIAKSGAKVEGTKNSLSDSNITETDNKYLSAVESGDTETAQRMVDEVAKENGYTEKVYHGTTDFGFTKLDASKGDDGISFFATDSLDVARTYSGGDNARNISDEGMSEEDYDNLVESYDEKVRDFIDVVCRTSGYYNFMSYSDNRFDDFRRTLENGTDSYDNVSSDLLEYVDEIVDSLYDNALYYDDSLTEEDFYDSDEIQEVYNALGDIEHILKGIYNYEDGSIGNYQFYANTEGLFEIDAEGKRWNQIPFDKYDTAGLHPIVNTRQLSRYAKYEGYKGVKITNVFDDGGRSTKYQSKPATVYIFFEPQAQVKSADTVTYDDNGNVIPLSERFKAENNDIRYSLSENIDNIEKILYNNNNPLSVINRAKSKNNSSINWVYKAEIFSVTENKKFHEKISEINQGSEAFSKNSAGEYMIPIENKIVFTDGNYDSPYVREIVEVLTEYQTEFEAIRERIYNVEKGKSSKQDEVQIIEQVYGDGYIISYNSSNNGVYDWQNGKRKGKSRRTVVKNYLNKQYRGRDDKQSQKTPINEIAPINEASSSDGVFFDAEKSRHTTADTKYSLSSIGNTFFGDPNVTVKDFENGRYKEAEGYKAYVDMCVRNYKQTRTDFDEASARASIDGQIEGIVEVAKAAKTAGYDIYDDNEKRSKKDKKKRLLFSSLEPNSDYFTSNDISTECDKRKNFADIYDAIVKREEAMGVPHDKRFFHDIDNYFYIHKVLADKGLTQPCRQCYVESMRKNLAPMAEAFLRLVTESDVNNKANDQLYHQEGKDKGNIKSNNAKLRTEVLKLLENNTEYGLSVNDLTVEMLTTEEGLAQLRIQAPLLYGAFNSFYGQSKPKMPKSATPFRFGELTALLTDSKGRIKRNLVNKINSTGGFRLQSYSDFQIQNYTDVLQVLFEAGTLGLSGHAYTKVPAFLDATEGTNLKRNISIFMYKDGDEWKIDKNDSFPYELNEIYDIVNNDDSGNTSIIAVSQNDDMSAWIMANDYVGYGIPFHKSGLKMDTVRDTDVRTDDGRIIKGYSETIDHTKHQSEVWASGENALTKVKKAINIYSFWDFENADNLSKSKLIEKNVKAYIDACDNAGYLPKFRNYVMNNDTVLNKTLQYAKELGFVPQNATVEDISFEYKGYTIPYGYYKFLGDFGMFTPKGQASPAKTLSLDNYDFDKAVEFFADSEKLHRNEILQQFANGEERARYRNSNYTAGELADIIRQKRDEVVDSIVAPVKKSLSYDDGTDQDYGTFYGRRIGKIDSYSGFVPQVGAKNATATEDIAPIQPTASEAENVENAVNEAGFAPIKAQQSVEATPISGVQKEVTPTESNAVEEKPTRRSELHQNIVDRLKGKFKEKGFDFDEVLSKAKNLSTFATVDNIPQRVMEKALGYKQGQILADETVNKVAQNESEGIKWLNSFTDRKNGLLAQISKQYNVKPGSKKSAAAQMYAEGFYVGKNNEIIEYGDKELAIDFPDVKVQESIKGLANDPRIRQIYDETLNAINESRSRNLYPEIPRLDNYFLHFRAMEDTFSRLGLPFNPNDIRAKDLPTDLNGVTADLKPGQPYFASAMHREGMRTSFDLLGGLERYLSSAKNQIYHIDDIQTLRALRNYIADTYGQAKGLESLDNLSEEDVQERIKQVYGSHLSTFAKFLNEEANVLAGKTTLIDRGLEGIIGRRGITFLNTINGQVGSNMVGWNISSSLTNFLPVAQTLAKGSKVDFTKAFVQTVSSKIGSIFGKTDSFVENNPTIIRRKGAERFYRTPFQKIGDTGYVLMSAVDDISTELIVRTKYNELVRKGMSEQKASFEADKWVSRLMGDRSLGQQPQLYNSKMLGLVTKFQLEVRNQLDSQFYDTIQEAKVSNEEIESKLLRNAKTAAKVTSTFVQLAVVQHLYGTVFESIAGYNPAFDIIDVLIKALGFDDDEEDEDTVLDNLEEGFFALLEDLPYTSTFTGGRIPISSALPVSEFIKGEDQYGNEKSRWDTLKEVAPYYVLPTGYGQIKKTANGLNMFSDEHPVAGSYTDSGNLRFPIDDTLKNRIQAGVFGQYASKNARTYFDEGYAPLKEKQIQEYKESDMPIADYWKYREGLKDFKSQDDKVAYINGLDISKKQKDVLKSYLYDEEGYKKENPEKYAFLEREGIGFLGYKELDENTQSAWSWAFKHQDEYEYYKQNGVLPGDYSTYYIPMLDFENEDNDAYSWAYDNPEKATFSKAITDNVVDYRKITKELYAIRADKDENGKAINGSAKEKKQKFIWNLDIDDGAKYILFKNEYNSCDDYNYEIIDYLNNRDDISFDEMKTILTSIGFEVDDEGNISWD